MFSLGYSAIIVDFSDGSYQNGADQPPFSVVLPHKNLMV